MKGFPDAAISFALDMFCSITGAPLKASQFFLEASMNSFCAASLAGVKELTLVIVLDALAALFPVWKLRYSAGEMSLASNGREPGAAFFGMVWITRSVRLSRIWTAFPTST